MRCESSGQFSQAPDQCREPLVTVEGEVTDAQSSSTKLSGATIKFYKSDTVAVTVESDWSGRYSALVPMGEITARGTKDGYIEQSLLIHVAGRLQVGQGTDLALSKV